VHRHDTRRIGSHPRRSLILRFESRTIQFLQISQIEYLNCKAPMLARRAAKVWKLGWSQFSMRTALFLFLVVGTVLGVGARFWREVRERGEAQRSLLAKPANATGTPSFTVNVTYAPEKRQPWFVKLVRMTVHREYERKLSSIAISGDSTDEQTAANISKVYGVDYLNISGNSSEQFVGNAVAANGLHSLTLDGSIAGSSSTHAIDQRSPASQLRMLHVDYRTRIRPKFLRWIGSSPKLNRVSFGGLSPMLLPMMTASVPSETDLRTDEFTLAMNQVSHFTRMGLGERIRPIHSQIDAVPLMLDALILRDEIKCLRFESATIVDVEPLKRFCEQSKVETLHLHDCDISRKCLRELVNLRNLTVLHLDWTPLVAEDLQVLATMKSLREIHGLWCGDEEAEAELRAALPECKITLHLQSDPKNQDKDF
jgi:hypothetical protein